MNENPCTNESDLTQEEIHTQIKGNPNKPTKKKRQNETHRKPESLYDSDLVEIEKQRG